MKMDNRCFKKLFSLQKTLNSLKIVYFKNNIYRFKQYYSHYISMLSPLWSRKRLEIGYFTEISQILQTYYNLNCWSKIPLEAYEPFSSS